MRRVIDELVAAVGAELALRHAQSRLRELEATPRMNGSPVDYHSIKAWVMQSRKAEGDRLSAVARVAYIEAIVAGAEPSDTTIDAHARDAAVVKQAICVGKEPRFLRIAIAAIAPRAGEPGRLAALQTQADQLGKEYLDDRIAQDVFESWLRTNLPELDRLIAAVDGPAKVREAILAYLHSSAAAALGNVYELAAGLRAVATLNSRGVMKADPTLKRLDRELAEVQELIAALSFAGRAAASLKLTELGDRRGVLLKAVKARKSELMGSVAVDASLLAERAVGGDVAAIEAVALIVRSDPGAFPHHLLERILEFQTESLCLHATAVVDAIINV